MADAKGYEGLAILEIMGHRRLAGRVSEAVIGGAAMVRIDVPSSPPATQFYGGAAIFCLTPTTEEVARAVAERDAKPALVAVWELPKLRAAPEDAEVEDSEYEDPGADEYEGGDEVLVLGA